MSKANKVELIGIDALKYNSADGCVGFRHWFAIHLIANRDVADLLERFARAECGGATLHGQNNVLVVEVFLLEQVNIWAAFVRSGCCLPIVALHALYFLQMFLFLFGQADRIGL